MNDLVEQAEQEPVDMAGLGKKWREKIDAALADDESYRTRCKKIEDMYSRAEAFAEDGGDREFQMFWANIEVLRPIIYSRPPQPVVQPRYKDRKELPRKASEVLERVLETDVELDDLHETLKLVRDCLALNGRGVPWVLDNGECIFVDREDFLCGRARHWKEVPWVARAAYLTRDEGVEAFGDVFLTASLEEHDNDGEEDSQQQERTALVWEIWDKTAAEVVWITEGVEDALAVSEPLINVKGFFPCPRPAYATLKPRTLIPVPDAVYYKDQLDEINELTSRISDLSESLRLKGFYASGAGDITKAIESAIRATDNKAIFVPVASLAAFGSGSIKDSIIWLPVREVAEVITNLVALRRQLIDDVYEITGVSDIMRGSTDARETAKAQNLKAQYGAVRVRERQQEMARVARDIFRIKAEVFTESYDIAALLSMAQVTDIPTNAAIEQMAMEQGQQEIPADVVTVETLDTLFKSERSRPFILDVETDSTIQPDEEAEKASRMEFLGAIGGFMQQIGPMVQQRPETGPFAAELMKFVASGFRASRELGSTIDQFAEQLKALGQQPQQPSPEQIKAEAEAKAIEQRAALEQQKLEADVRKKDFDARAAMGGLMLKEKELGLKEGELSLKYERLDLDEATATTDAAFKAVEVNIEQDQERAVRLGND